MPNMSNDQKGHQKYGLLPEKVAEDEPWEKLCVDTK